MNGWINIINYEKVVESEKTAKWQYTRHCEELGTEIKKLREEVGLALLIFGTIHNLLC